MRVCAFVNVCVGVVLGVGVGVCECKQLQQQA